MFKRLVPLRSVSASVRICGANCARQLISCLFTIVISICTPHSITPLVGLDERCCPLCTSAVQPRSVTAFQGRGGRRCEHCDRTTVLPRNSRVNARDFLGAEQAANRNLGGVLRLPFYYLDSLLSAIQGFRGSAAFGRHGGPLVVNKKSAAGAVQPSPLVPPTPSPEGETTPSDSTKFSSPAGETKIKSPPSQGLSTKTVDLITPPESKVVVLEPGPPPPVIIDKPSYEGVGGKTCDPAGTLAEKPPTSAGSETGLPGDTTEKYGFLSKPSVVPGGELVGGASDDADGETRDIVTAVETPSVSSENCALTPAVDGEKNTTQQAEVKLKKKKGPEQPKAKLLPESKHELSQKLPRGGHSELRVFFGVSPLTLLNKICHGQRSACTAEFADSLYQAVRQVTEDSTFTRDRVKIGAVSARAGGVEQVVTIRNDGDLQLAQAVKQVLLEIPRCTSANNAFPICQTVTGKQLARHNVKTEVTSIKHVR